MTDTDQAWKEGDVIAGRYALEVELGRGAMGAVWRASQINLGRHVALKLMLPEYAYKPGARVRFEREARVSSQLKHPSAVVVHDFGEEDGQLFIAMEMLIGHSLRAIVDEDLPPVPLEQTLEILRPVSDALAAAHELGLVHRDVKPENIFLEESGEEMRVVVVDFGLAFIEDGGSRSGRMTEEGMTAGTPEYMSPEQVAGDPVGPAADVYSLGCVLYEMLVGRTPFSGTPMQLLTQHLFSAPRSVREVTPELELPRQLEDLCMWMLAKSPHERPSMEVVRGLLTRQSGGEVRDRGRDKSYLKGREARMISAVPKGEAATLTALYQGADTPSSEHVQLAVVGQLSGDLAVGLGANGFLAYIVGDEETTEGATAIFAPNATPKELEALVATGTPVITDAEPTDMERVTALLRLGVSEVVHRPVRAPVLSKKIYRAIRRAKRRTG